MPNFDNQTIQLAILAVTALVLLLQTVALLVILITVRKTASSLKNEVEDLRSALMPVIYNTRELLGRLTPRVEATVEDLAQIAKSLRVQTEELQASAREVGERLRTQVSRVDSMVTTVLDTVDRTGDFLAEAVSKPVRQISGLVASVKAMVESLRASEFGKQRNHSSVEEDPFI
jgi:methyl-accepting chemotaxis protein